MCWSSGVPGPRMGKGGSLGGWTHQQPHTDRSDCLVAEGGRCGSSLALPAHLAQPGTVLFLAAGLPSSPAYPWPQPGSDSRQHCHPQPSPCVLALHLGSPRPPLLPRQGRVPGLSSATQLARGRGRSKERPTPTSPPQEQLKMKHTRLHSSARIRSRHPHPPLPALEMPPGPPSIPRPRHPRSRLSPRQKLIGKLGGRKRLHPLPYLPVERRSGKGSSEGKRQLPAGPAARIAQGCGGRGAGGEGKRSDRLCKDTNKRH